MARQTGVPWRSNAWFDRTYSNALGEIDWGRGHLDRQHGIASIWPISLAPEAVDVPEVPADENHLGAGDDEPKARLAGTTGHSRERAFNLFERALVAIVASR
jgi:hypothetical protein